MQPMINIVPNSGIQFWDIDLDTDALPRVVRHFWEEPVGTVPDETGAFPVVLHEVRMEEDGGFVVEHTGQRPSMEDTYPVHPKAALEMHMGKWVPVPYFRVKAQTAGGREQFDRGPSNWARMRLVEHPAAGQGHTHRLTVAFDTSLLPLREGGAYVAPSPENSAQQSEFAFVPGVSDNGWLIDEAWMGEWLHEMLVELRTEQRRGRKLRPEDMPHGCEHYARYLTFLAVLDEIDVMPRLRLLDVVSQPLGYVPVAVDLVLDIGNARTCGILIEEHPGQGINLSDSYPLALRDLSRPELLHGKPFDSRVEFSRPQLGREAISRRSGRASAFSWPSPVRVGPEAARLAGARLGTEGATGISSPKRYLWDSRPSSQGWRFNARGGDPTVIDPPVSGAFMAWVTEDGRVLKQRGAGQPAARARFARTSMFTFMLAEILLQALCFINAPGTLMQRRDADKPRRLRSVLLTMPPGMPVAEQRILRARAGEAIRLAWAMLGWAGTVPEPLVKAELDEASATQVVWLHNEITERLQGDGAALLELVGRPRPELGNEPSLRVASIDIGGGTTDLMVTTYRRQGEAIIPNQEFRESFKIAGDDVLERILVQLLLPAIARALAAAGVRDPQALLTRTLGQDPGGMPEQERQLRRLFVNTVLVPVGIAVLGAYENIEGRDHGEVLRRTIGDVLGADLAAAARPLGFFDDAAAAAGASSFHVAEVEIIADTRRIEPLITAVLGPVLADLCEAAWSCDCDVLLLSGRPSRLRVVTDIVLAKAPVPPHRVIAMHRYRVGEKYPFRDAANRIDDPKTTAVVGAALCLQAEGRLRNFTLRTRHFAMRSTARIIGRMDNSGQIRDANVLLADLDLDAPPRDDIGFTMEFQTETQIGFRQLPIERWTATPLYVMEFANPDNARAFDLPLRVKVSRRPSERDDDPEEGARELFQIEEIVDSGGAGQPERVLTLRLQTLQDESGYWRDTGRLGVA
jgi:hypothetical protein